ncbi:MAG: hypothetical protein ACT4OP_06190 [Actinomycetota bacterium]
MAILRLIHIVGAVFWAGGVMMIGWFISPSARRTGPAAGPFMQSLLKSRVADVMVTAGVVTVLAGGWLLGIRGIALNAWQGWALLTGAAAGVAALLFGIIRQRPTAARIQQLGAALQASGSPPTAEQTSELAMLQIRMGRYANLLAGLMVVAVAGMALGG